MRTRAAARAVVSVAGACNAPAAAAPRVSEGGMMRRVPSAVALLEAAQLVRTESGKHLQMHLQMIASGAPARRLQGGNRRRAASVAAQRFASRRSKADAAGAAAAAAQQASTR
jgi:hypothetical protein